MLAFCLFIFFYFCLPLCLSISLFKNFSLFLSLSLYVYHFFFFCLLRKSFLLKLFIFPHLIFFLRLFSHFSISISWNFHPFNECCFRHISTCVIYNIEMVYTYLFQPSIIFLQCVGLTHLFQLSFDLHGSFLLISMGFNGSPLVSCMRRYFSKRQKKKRKGLSKGKATCREKASNFPETQSLK